MALSSRGQTGANLLTILERRLDNVVYRLGFGDSRAQARQLVTHGHISVNGKRRDIASSLVEAGDVISINERSRNNGHFQGLTEVLEHQNVPVWLVLNPSAMSGTVASLPTRDQIEVPIDEQLIVEFYSR